MRISMNIFIKVVGVMSLVDSLPSTKNVFFVKGQNYSGPKPKMNHQPVVPGKEFGPRQQPEAKSISSTSSVHLGDCAPRSSFEFHIGGRSGRGAIGNTIDAKIDMVMSSNNRNCQILNEQGDEAPQAFFGFLNDGPSGPVDIDTELVGTQFACEDLVGNHNSIVLTCEVATPIIAVYRDDSNTVVEATLTATKNNGDQRFELSNGKRSGNTIKGETRKKIKDTANEKVPVSFAEANDTGITIKHDQNSNIDDGIALVQVSVANDGDDDEHLLRTFIVNTKKIKNPKKRNLISNQVNCCEISDEGDIEAEVLGLTDEPVHVFARLGLKLDSVDDPIGVVDVDAILRGPSAKLTVHGGWARFALSEHGVTEGQTDGWDFLVLDSYFTDPQDESQFLGHANMASNSVDASSKNKKTKTNSRRSKLSAAPSDDEKSVSSEMKMGRKPRSRPANLRRGLSTGIHKKILVHGYCSSNPWPTNYFTSYAVFDDVDSSGQQNWSHDTFALKIDKFADVNNIEGCGCIAHSQGGAACLHLYNYYWSCLDYPNNSGRRIQSVGTPYQGTNLAGNLAVLGDVFGAGCGYNNDLTHSGATNWLNSISSSARASVNYYTTSFQDKWWRYDYCHVATDLFLGDPEDGTTERSAGQLPNGVNRGHKAGWCHTTGMRDPAQYYDGSRNSEMNANAQY